MPLEMKYFVLKPRGDGPYARASREAMIAYANAIRFHDPELAEALIEWYEREERIADLEVFLRKLDKDRTQRKRGKEE